MSAFLKPLSIELDSMKCNGVKKRLNNGMEVNCPVYPLMCVVDAVAKPKVQNLSI